MGLSSRINTRSSPLGLILLSRLISHIRLPPRIARRVAPLVFTSQRYMSRVLVLLETVSSPYAASSRAPASSSDFPPVFHFISRFRCFRLQRYLLTISKTRGPRCLIASLQYLFFIHFCRLARLPARRPPAVNFPHLHIPPLIFPR